MGAWSFITYHKELSLAGTPGLLDISPPPAAAAGGSQDYLMLVHLA